MSQAGANSSGGGGPSTPGVIVTKFTADGNFLINSSTVMVDVYAWGGGSGGGGGAVDDDPNHPSGGNGGGQGYFVNMTFQASAFSPSTAVVIGQGGNGGAGAPIGGGFTMNGDPGGDTIVTLAIGNMIAWGSTGATGGLSGGISQNTVAAASMGPFGWNPDGSSKGPNEFISGSNGTTFDNYIPGIGTAGGYGGFLNGGSHDGLKGGDVLLGAQNLFLIAGSNQTLLFGGLGGVVEGGNGGDGNAGNTISFISGGTGGGGGGANEVGDGGTGGNGAIPGGGGGGGGAAEILMGAGGTGGNGARGEVWFIEYL